MKKFIILTSLMLPIIISTSMMISSCTVSQKITDKTGTQLWGENCGRCHNAPGPGEFSGANWELIGKHMRVRANITETEEQKIVEFLKTTGNS